MVQKVVTPCQLPGLPVVHSSPAHHQRPIFGNYWSRHRSAPYIGTGLTGIGLRTMLGSGIVSARGPFRSAKTAAGPLHTRELHWTWLSPGFSGGGNGPGGSQSDRCAAAHPPGPVGQLSKAWPVAPRTIEQLSCSFTARGYQARRAWPRRIDGNIASKDG